MRKNVSKTVVLLAMLLLCIGGNAYAQRTITGTVKDAATGQTLPGVNVYVKENQAIGQFSNVDGRFRIQLPAQGKTLVFSFIGYVPQEVSVGAQNTIDVLLKEDSKQLAEVVVTALGITKPSKSVGYAVSKVSTDEVVRVNSINPASALQGKVAGLNIQGVGSSGVTSSSSIIIRGAKSLDKSNSPIFVIDGMVITEPITGYLSGTDWGSQLKNLNPDDYESITVLKGAAATSLYGSRGANGAIVIVSKGGKYGKRGIGVEMSQTIELMDIYAPHMKLQNIYGAGAPGNGFEGGFLADGTLQKTTVSFGPKMDGQLLDQHFLKGEKTPYSPQPNNWKALYQNGFYTNTNLAINGGNDKTSFRASYSYTDNKGVFKFNQFIRNAISFRLVSELNEIFTVEAGVNYAFSEAINGASQGGWAWDSNLGMLATRNMPRSFDLNRYADVYRDPITKAVETDSPFGTLRSYLHSRDMNKRERKEQSLLSNMQIRAKIAPWLSATIRGNYSLYAISGLEKSFGTGANYSGGGHYARSGSLSGEYNTLGMLTSSLKFLNDDLTLDLSAIGEIYGNTEGHSWYKTTQGGLVTPAFFAYSNSRLAMIPSYNYSYPNSRTLGLSGIINIGWKDQLFLEVTGRNDWLSSMTYPKYMSDVSNNYSVFYPSTSLSWLFNETFSLPEWFSQGKFRASLAYVGLGTSAYNTTSGYGVFYQGASFDADRNSVLIANPNLGVLQNKSLKPELQRSIELGLDLRFFQERLNLDVAFYRTNTFNQILQLGSVAESGASQILINAGNIQNQGFEIQIDGVPVRTNDFRWSIGGNFTVNRGKVVKLHDYLKEYSLMGAYDAGPEIWAYEGGGFGIITAPMSEYGSTRTKFNNPDNPKDPRNGKYLISYWGKTGDPNKTYVYGWVTDADKGKLERHKIGKVEPDFLAGMNTSLSYKSFDIYAQIDARVGGNFFSNSLKYASQTGALYSSLYGRDKGHGGIARTNYMGETVYDGIMLDAVFDEGVTAPSKGDPSVLVDVGGLTYKEAVDKGLIEPSMASAFHYWNGGWGAPVDQFVVDNTWVRLREVTLMYRIPEKWIRKIKLQDVRLGATVRNVGYLYNALPDNLNPESLSSNDPLRPIDIGGVPYSRTFSFSLNVKF